MAASRIAYLILIGLIAGQLGGCIGAVATGTAVGISVAHDRRTAGTVLDDEGIELKALRLVFEDKELREQTHINVTSYNLQVLVTGEAPTRELMDRLIDGIRRIPKVRKVYNEIAIAAPSALVSRSSDSLLTTKVKTRLFTIKNFDATRVKVVTERGVVYLMGLVSAQEAEAATEAARQVGGVLKVVKLFELVDLEPASNATE